MSNRSNAFDGLPFRKYEALGNDYLVIDPRNHSAPLGPPAVRRLCDRRYGVGADGVLWGPLVEPEGFRLRIFNPDGSEAEKSGNGVRIFARYLHDAGYVHDSCGVILTAGGRVSFQFLDGAAHRIEVDMGTVTFWSEHIPVSGPHREVVDEVMEVDGRQFRVTCLSIGNPHCIVRFDATTEGDVRHFGPLIEAHSNFPNRTNVQFLDVVSREHIRIGIWERGAGYTLSSGSSSCAAASAAYRLGLVDRQVNVQMPGGVLRIDLGDDGHVRMTGDVHSVMEGHLCADLAEAISSTLNEAAVTGTRRSP
jgi:diaminopimelate epimerase